MSTNKKTARKAIQNKINFDDFLFFVKESEKQKRLDNIKGNMRLNRLYLAMISAMSNQL